MADHIAAIKAEPKDLQQVGVKGMKWGVRRSSSELRAAAKARGDASTKKTESSDNSKSAASSASTKKPENSIQDNVESSSARYARLAGQAKAGQASAMSEQDLKFFNARTDALAKIDKMYETQPSWLRTTAVNVLQQTAQKQMQSIADEIAGKYIGTPLKDAIKGTSDAAAAAKKSAEAASSGGSTKKVTDSLAKAVEAVQSASSTSPASTKTAAAATTPAPKHRASFSDRAKSAAQKTAQATATSVANSKRSKADKQYEETKKKIADIEERKKSDPSLMNISESLRYYQANPTANPTPPAGLTPNAYRIWQDAVREVRGE
jgi:hypothetical protein